MYEDTRKRIKSIIAEQNPWWKGHSVPDYLALATERPLAKHLWKYMLSSPLKRYFIILGPRRVGKTTVMYQTVRHLLNNHISPDKMQWVRLDHPLLMSLDLGFIVKDAIKLAKADKEKPLYLFLDELVYAKEWDKWLKTFYDEHWPVHIIASSSATAALKKGGESGVGRWEEFHLTPYLLTELLQLYNKPIKFPHSEKKQCLFNTIESLSKSLPHTQINFEKERKLLIGLGGFPELLAGSKIEEDKLLESIKQGMTSELKDFPYIKKKYKNHLNDISKIEDESLYDLWDAERETKDNPDDEIAKNAFPALKKLHDQLLENKKRIISMVLKEYKKQSKDNPFKDNQLVKYFHKAQQTLRSNAIERAIYKDIPQSYRIDSPLILERLFYILASQITGLLSLRTISQDIQVSASTLERYLSYLTQTYLVFALSNYDNNERSVQRRQKKTYFVDVAIQNAALQKETDQIFNDPSEMGKLQENLLASHLYHLGKQSGIRLYHWKRREHEVDLIYDDPIKPLAFEIRSSKTHSRSDLRKFRRENPKFQCYYVAPELPFISPEESPSGVGDLSLDFLLLAIGLQHDKALSLFFGSREK